MTTTKDTPDINTLIIHADGAEPTGRVLPDSVDKEYVEYVECIITPSGEKSFFYMIPRSEVDRMTDDDGEPTGYEPDWQDYIDRVDAPNS